MSPFDEDERLLRTRFAELKKHDARTAPDFGKMTSTPRPLRSRSPWRVIVPIASLAAAAMLVLWCGAQTMLSESAPSSAAAPAPAPAAAVGGEARAVMMLDPTPLDFLLDTSGSGIAGATPNVGTHANPIKGW